MLNVQSLTNLQGQNTKVKCVVHAQVRNMENEISLHTEKGSEAALGVLCSSCIGWHQGHTECGDDIQLVFHAIGRGREI